MQNSKCKSNDVVPLAQTRPYRGLASAVAARRVANQKINIVSYEAGTWSYPHIRTGKRPRYGPRTRTSGTIACVLALLLICAFSGPVLGAGVNDILAKMPAQSPAAGQSLAAEIVTLGPAAIKEICGLVVEPGKGDDANPRYALHGVAMYVMRPDSGAERAMLEGALLEAFAAAQNLEVKAFVLEQLNFVAQNTSIPALSALLTDERLCEPAALALQTIGTPEAAATIAKALADAKGKNQLTIIRALGEMREKSSAPAILPLASSEDAMVRQASWFALASLGFAPATEVLAKAAETKTGYERSLATRAYLLLARRLAEAGDKEACAKICRGLLATRTAPAESNVYCAALTSLADALGTGAVGEVLTALDSKDGKISAAALQILCGIEGADLIAPLTTKLKSATPENRASMIAALGRRGDKAALPLFKEALKDEDANVRGAAIGAVAGVGGDENVSALIALLDAGKADDVKALKQALMTIKAPGFSSIAGGAVPKASPAAKIALVEILGARGANDQVSVVLFAAADKEAPLRMAALRALPAVVGAVEAPKLLEMMLASTVAGERAEIGKAVLAACKKTTDSAAPILAVLPRAAGDARSDLLKLLARLGGDAALQAVIAESKSETPAAKESAIRALGEWVDSAAAPTLLTIAGEAKEQIQHVLALRGYLRMLTLPPARKPVQTVEMLKQLAATARTADEKKLILGALSNVRCIEAMTLAAASLDQDETKAEASAAVITIICPADDSAGLQGAAVAEALEKALKLTSSDSLKKKGQAYLPKVKR